MIGQSDIQSFQPKFLKKYGTALAFPAYPCKSLAEHVTITANVGEEMRKAVEDYRNDVISREYPEENTHTFAIKDEEYEAFIQKAQQRVYIHTR